MERILQCEINPTANSSSYVMQPQRARNVKCLYQAATIGYEYNEKGYNIKRNNATSYLIAYTKSGECTVEYEGASFTLNAGSLLFINLANESSIRALDSHWEIYFMHVVGSDIDDIYRNFTKNQGYYIEQYESRFVDDFQRLYQSCTAPVVNFYDISSQIYTMLMDILKHATSADYHSIVNHAMEYIEQNYTKELSINELSKSLFVSKYFLIRKFHEQTGYSPKQYLTKIRLDKAKQLLAQTNHSIAEIAQAVGFHNEKNIYYAFKSLTGLSPKEFRENY
ncbi:MAG: helix-turn-helix transcriptional regulator [Clostridia bacterium]|nr:helix-turn-helix transcriptional regulator [Clostridia bacterium]